MGSPLLSRGYMQGRHCTLALQSSSCFLGKDMLASGIQTAEFASTSDAHSSSWAGGADAPAGTSDGSAYDSHIPLHPLQKGAVAVLSAFGALANPARADLVAALGETTGEAALRNMRDRMVATTSGRKILVDRPHITNESVAHAWDAPPGSFGAAYSRFMGSRRFQPNDRPPVRFVDDEELAYVAARSREVHDFWHVLFGCPTTVLGELALKALEAVQTGMPMPALAVTGASWRLPAEQRSRLFRHYLPWAFQAGMRSADLITLYYEEHFEEDLTDLRARWRITPAPSFKTQLKPAQAKQAS